MSGVTPDLLAPSTALAAPDPAPAHLEPIDEVHQRFHQVILLELPAGSLHRGWVPFPATKKYRINLSNFTMESVECVEHGMFMRKFSKSIEDLKFRFILRLHFSFLTQFFGFLFSWAKHGASSYLMASAQIFQFLYDSYL